MPIRAVARGRRPRSRGPTLRVPWAGVLLRAALLCLGLPGLAGAVSLSLVPGAVAPATGGAFSLDLVVSGLGAGAAPSLGGYDVAVAYDATRVSFTGASFAGALGAVPAEAFAGTVEGPGSVSLAAVSLLDPAALDALQPASFTLATLGFVADVEAGSVIAISSALLSDGFGRPIGLTLPLGDAAISPVPGSAVPEPGAFLLYAAGLAVVGLALRAQHRG